MRSGARTLARPGKPDARTREPGVTDEDRTRLRPVHNRPPSPDGFGHHGRLDGAVSEAGVEPTLLRPERRVLPQTLLAGGQGRNRTDLSRASTERRHQTSYLTNHLEHHEGIEPSAGT